MTQEPAPGTLRLDPPHAGVFRTIYFLAVATVGLFVVVTGVFGLYKGPDDDSSFSLDDPFFNPTGVSGEGFTQSETPATIEDFQEAAAAGEVFSVQEAGDELRYELYTGPGLHIAELDEGQTLDEVLAEAGASRDEIPLVRGADSQDFGSDDGDSADYNRNIMIILTLLTAVMFGAAILGVGSVYNPLRAGLLLAGMVVFLIGMVYWGNASNDWLGFIMTSLNLVVLLACIPWLNDGLPGAAGRPRIAVEPPPPSHEEPPAAMA